MDKIGLIERGWVQYAERVLPKNAPRIQMQECRRSFFAGAAHLFGALTDAVGADEVSEDAGMDIMAGVEAEIGAHIEGVLEGRR